MSQNPEGSGNAIGGDAVECNLTTVGEMKSTLAHRVAGGAPDSVESLVNRLLRLVEHGWLFPTYTVYVSSKSTTFA